jgi:hypothetical protein
MWIKWCRFCVTFSYLYVKHGNTTGGRGCLTAIQHLIRWWTNSCTRKFKRVWRMLCAGRGLNCGKTKLGFWPRQCAGSRVTPHPQLCGKTSDIRCEPFAIFYGISTAEFFLFLEIKTTLKGRRFQTIEEIKESALRNLRFITESAFREAFKQWKVGWVRCIASRGVLFEGDSA